MATHDAEYCCPVCHNVYQDAVEVPCCNELFCEECVQSCCDCPSCHAPLDPSACKPNIPIRRIVASLPTPCTNQGCQAVVQRAFLRKHLDECPFALVPCRNSTLCGLVVRHDLEQHEQELCHYRPVACPHGCGERLFSAELGTHVKNECPRTEVPCPEGCGVVLPRSELRDHIRDECPCVEVQCGNEDEDTGERCAFRCQRQDLSEHHEQCPFQQVTCEHPGCSKKMTQRRFAAHDAECPFKPTMCPNNCGQIVPRGAITEHVKRACPMERVKCEYHRFGCTEMVLRRNLHEHLKSNLQTHFELVTRAFQRKNEETHTLRQAYLQLTNRLDDLAQSFDRQAVRCEETIQVLGQELDTTKVQLSKALEEISELRDKSRSQGPPRRVDRDGRAFEGRKFECTHVMSEAHKNYISSLVWSANLLISGAWDCTIKVWDVSHQYKLLKVLEGHERCVRTLATSGALLISGSEDQSIIIWQLDDFSYVTTLCGHQRAVVTLITHKGVLYSGSYDHTIRAWDLDTYECLNTVTAHDGWVRVVTVHRNVLYSGGEDCLVKAWDLPSMQCTRRFMGHKGYVCALTCSEHFLASGSEDTTIRVWDVNTGECLYTLIGHGEYVQALAMVGRVLFSASEDTTIKIWDLRGHPGECTQTLRGHEEGINALVLVGRNVVTASDDGCIRVWK